MEGSGVRARPRRGSSRDRAIRPERREAETAVDAAVGAVLHGADGVLTRSMPLVETGEHWLRQISRPDSGLSADDRCLLLDLEVP
jgi:hypothetical protein